MSDDVTSRHRIQAVQFAYASHNINSILETTQKAIY